MSEEPKFAVDHMLIRVGKYLRILGYDAVLPERGTRTHELIRQANTEGRVFLTCNTRLADEYPVPRKTILLEPAEPVGQLEIVVAKLGLDTKRSLFSRCIRCNVELADVADKKSIQGKVHPNVYARHDRFYICSSCGTVFWHGSHVANTRAKLRLKTS